MAATAAVSAESVAGTGVGMREFDAASAAPVTVVPTMVPATPTTQANEL
jgi:hypothetical protein